MMKSKYRQAIFTFAFAFFIIAAGFLAFRYYSEKLKIKTLNQVKESRMSFKEDNSLEAVILDRPWEDEGWNDAEEITLPIKYQAIVSEVCDIFHIPKKEDDKIYKKEEREFLIKYDADGKKINMYINENTCEFSFWMEEIPEDNIEGNSDDSVKELKRQKENQESKMYQLIVELSRSLSANGFLILGMYDESELMEPEYMKRDLIGCDNTIFAHGDKVYVVLLPEYIFENNNFIALVYDSKTAQYCGCKFTIIEK